MHLSSIDFAGEQERSAIDLIHKPMQSEIRLHGLFFAMIREARGSFCIQPNPKNFSTQTVLTLLNYSCSIVLKLHL